MNSTPWRFDEFEFDPADGRLEHLRSRRAVMLRPQAARLLLALLEAPGRVVDRGTLRAAIWDAGTVVDFESGLAALMRELRQALDELAGKAGLLETIPRRGYRLKVEVSPPVDSGGSGAVHEAPSTQARQPRRWRPWAVAGAVAVLGMVAWSFRPGMQMQPGPAPPPGAATMADTASRMLAVLPFTVYRGDANTDTRLELLLADALLAELWRAELQGLALIGRATLLPYAGREDVAGAVARDLGVEFLIEGSVIRQDEGWQVTARLLAMPGGRVLWSESVDAPDQDQLPVQDVVQRLVVSLAAAWPAVPE